jgi:hypothetical protein
VDPLPPTSAELANLLRRVRVAVEEERVRVTDYAREGAAALDWNEWDIIEQIRELTAPDWLRCEQSTDPDRPSLIWVFEPDYWDGGKLWIRLVERSGVLVVSFHRG